MGNSGSGKSTLVRGRRQLLVPTHRSHVPATTLWALSPPSPPTALLPHCPSSHQLDVLAGNTYGGCTVGGRVLVNGRPRDPAAFAALSSYVLQRDVLDACATVS